MINFILFVLFILFSVGLLYVGSFVFKALFGFKLRMSDLKQRNDPDNKVVPSSDGKYSVITKKDRITTLIKTLKLKGFMGPARDQKELVTDGVVTDMVNDLETHQVALVWELPEHDLTIEELDYNTAAATGNVACSHAIVTPSHRVAYESKLDT